MKQILQDLSSGETSLVDIPCPAIGKNEFLICSSKSLVSLGTERMLLEFGNASLIGKIKMQPEKVQQVLSKIKTDGLFPTLDTVRNKLSRPIPLGYSNVGRIVGSSGQDGEFQIGDRVVSNGPHAEMVVGHMNLMAKIPDKVSDDQAAFTVIGSIGLQGIRLLQPTIGERIVVFGLGLIGLLCVQLLRANGCSVVGVDFDKNKLKLAERFGAQTVDLSEGIDPIRFAHDWAKGEGVDGVIITASSKRDDIVHQAATMCRKRGRIVLVGVVGLNLKRSDFYEKELSFQVSCSYGPGRYDNNYEKLGLDYPIGFVRWTEKRNFEAILGLLESGVLDVEPLISNRYEFESSLEAYKSLGSSSVLGILLNYKNQEKYEQKLIQKFDLIPGASKELATIDSLKVGLIGGGNFSSAKTVPLLHKMKAVSLDTIVTKAGVSGSHLARRYHFRYSSTDIKDIFQSEEINTVFILTPHNSHADFVSEGLRSGKHVFVEKPLCLNCEELEQIRSVYQVASGALMVGFNRRFSPHSQKIKKAVSRISGPLSMVYTVNAGHIPKEHWTQDPKIGGGRLIGEVCHFVDLLRYFAGSEIIEAKKNLMNRDDNEPLDTVTLSVSFANGSTGTVHYLTNGHKTFEKERIEIFGDGKVVECHNFRKTKFYGFGMLKSFKTFSQDKGHRGCIEAFVNSLQKADIQLPISFEEIYEVTKLTIDLNSTATWTRE